ncbi:hypothetical protein N9S18_01360 [Flavobacteriaceae bacterium]|nr:hypothetical protein [Flavobacteriaceae bacterium]
MNILIIGGTRFLGKLLAEKFILSKEINLTVLSRNPLVNQFKCNTLNYEKKEGLKYLKDIHFDLVYDFLAYDRDDIIGIKRDLNFSKYLFISTAWVKKLNLNNSIDKLVHDLDKKHVSKLSPTTKKYLLGKRDAENTLCDLFDKKLFNIIRLPIFFGINDHTKRLSFYLSRLSKNEPLIIVNSGENICQIAYVEDLAKLLYHFSEEKIIKKIINALPNNSISVNNFIKTLKKYNNSNSKIIHVSDYILKKEFPEYLDMEPLWKENFIETGNNNIFKELNFTLTDIDKWIKIVSKKINKDYFCTKEFLYKEKKIINEILYK